MVNALINDVFIEEKALPPAHAEQGSTIRHPAYRFEKYTLKYTLVKDLGLIFVAVYQSLLHLTWVDTLLDNIQTIFTKIYHEKLESPNATVFRYKFDQYFDQQMQELGAEQPDSVQAAKAGLSRKKEALENGDTGGPPPPSLPDLPKVQPGAVPNVKDSTLNTQMQSDSSRPTTPIPGHLISGKPVSSPRGSRRARKAANAANATSAASSGDEGRKGKTKAVTAKKMRKWDADGLADEDDGVSLDYSADVTDGTNGFTSPPVESVSGDSFGTRTKKGEFVLKDLGDEVNSILSESKNSKTSNGNGVVGSSFNAISGYFRNIVGGKTLSKEDLEKPLRSMEDHLIRKNVAREAAVRLCSSVETELIGKKTGTFESIDTALRSAMESSLRKILTPTSSLDLIREIQSTTSPLSSSVKPRPYVISIVGVNGVGKSTNLSKIAFFLLQNNYRVLIAACDTFRSGAVEQLNVHVRNLAELSARENAGHVSLYQKGYGKDAANVAKDAISFAASEKYDVVLIDTAGRRHNDTRLMSSLEKFAQFAQPDKIFMVGEALVGTDSVAQARNFNAAFGSSRGLDGFIISKCDTVGDMVGTLVSMVHATGIPVVFLGVGQHYGDLRGLSVGWAVNLLMS